MDKARAIDILKALTELYPEVRAAFEARGFKEQSHKTIGEWTTGLLRRTSWLSRRLRPMLR